MTKFIRFGFVSFIVKGSLLTSLYRSNGRLRYRTTDVDQGVEMLNALDTECWLSSVFSVLRTYYAQAVFPAALGLAFLYMTVLGFDGLAIGYGESVGLPEQTLSFFRSYGSAAGVLGALSYAVITRNIGVRLTGIIGLTCQDVFLLLAVASIWLPGSPWAPSKYFDTLTPSSWLDDFVASLAPTGDARIRTTNSTATDVWTLQTSDGTSLVSILTFLVGIASARFGLWMADLAIIHQMQLATPEDQRNTVFGTQNAICNAFSVIKDLLVIVLPSPHTFGICIIVSYAFVVSGMLLYVYYLAKVSDFNDHK